MKKKINYSKKLNISESRKIFLIVLTNTWEEFFELNFTLISIQSKTVLVGGVFYYVYLVLGLEEKSTFIQLQKYICLGT